MWFFLKLRYKQVLIFIFVFLQIVVKNIFFLNVEIFEIDVDKKDYVFRIKLKDNGRTFYIQVENENVQNDWMQAICFVKVVGYYGDNLQVCIIQ